MLRRNVLIFHTGALGDFVLAWPLVVAMGRLYPQSRVIVVAPAQKGALAEKVLRVDSADIEGGWRGLFAEGASLPERQGKMLAEAHAVVGFVGGEDSPWAENVQKLNADANVVGLRQIPPAEFRGHVLNFLLEQLANQPAIRAGTEQIIRSIRDRGVATRREVGRDIVVHPGSGSREKCWPRERFVELIQRLRRDGRDVRVLIGEVEEERWSKGEIAQLNDVATSLHRPAAYVELADELSRAAVVVANDSGPGHLAAMLGVPTVSIFGPTDPARWSPVGPSVHVFHEVPCEPLKLEQICDTIRGLG